MDGRLICRESLRFESIRIRIDGAKTVIRSEDSPNFFFLTVFLGHNPDFR